MSVEPWKRKILSQRDFKSLLVIKVPQCPGLDNNARIRRFQNGLPQGIYSLLQETTGDVPTDGRQLDPGKQTEGMEFGGGKVRRKVLSKEGRFHKMEGLRGSKIWTKDESGNGTLKGGNVLEQCRPLVRGSGGALESSGNQAQGPGLPALKVQVAFSVDASTC